MKRFIQMLNFIAVSFYFIPLISCESAENVWYKDFEQASRSALNEDKDLLIDFGGSDWCAPCELLKNNILTKVAFFKKARKHFVLVDIDLLLRAPMPPEQKERYQDLQKEYGISSFPSIVLTTPDGKPYAQTTYIPKISSPKAYWNHIDKLRQRGTTLREEFERAAHYKGFNRASALVDGMAIVPFSYVERFYSDIVTEISTLDPDDKTGYQKFLAGRNAIKELQNRDLLQSLTVEEIKHVIDKHNLKGEALQEAWLLISIIQIRDANFQDAEKSIENCLTARSTCNKFDQGDLRPFTNKSVERIRNKLKIKKDNELQRIKILNQIITQEIPCPAEMSCGDRFLLTREVRPFTGDAYLLELIKQTENLSGEKRIAEISAKINAKITMDAGHKIKEFFPTMNSINKLMEMAILETNEKIVEQYFPDYWLWFKNSKVVK